MTKEYGAFVEVTCEEEHRTCLSSLIETVGKCGLDKSFDVIVEDVHNRILVCPNTIDLNSVIGAYYSAILT
jgi:hypothetical protein